MAKAQASGTGKPRAEVLVCDNRKARFLFEILDTVEAGLVLKGTEVKVMRQGKMTLDESYAKVEGAEAWLVGANIPVYSHGNLMNHEPKRRRKLLLHRREIARLGARTLQQGLTLVPLRVYFDARGHAKISIGVGKGRKTHDKRTALRDREHKRDLRRDD